MICTVHVSPGPTHCSMTRPLLPTPTLESHHVISNYDKMHNKQLQHNKNSPYLSLAIFIVFFISPAVTIKINVTWSKWNPNGVTYFLDVASPLDYQNHRHHPF